MSFSLDDFYQRNRRALIWLILIGLLWLLQDFFGLIFLTFVLAFIATPLARLGQSRVRLPEWASLTLVYLCFLLVLGSFIKYVTPSVIQEANRFMSNLGEVQEKLVKLKTGLVDKYPGMERPLRGYMRSVLDDKSLESVDNELGQKQRQLELADSDLTQFSYNANVPPDLKPRLEQYFDRETELLAGSLKIGRASCRERV